MKSNKPNIFLRILRESQYTTLGSIFLLLMLPVARYITPYFNQWRILFFICIALWPIEWIIREIITAKKNGVNGFRMWLSTKDVYEKVCMVIFIVSPLFILLTVIPFLNTISLFALAFGMGLAGCDLFGGCDTGWMLWPSIILLTAYTYMLIGYSITKIIVEIRNIKK